MKITSAMMYRCSHSDMVRELKKKVMSCASLLTPLTDITSMACIMRGIEQPRPAILGSSMLTEDNYAISGGIGAFR